MYSFSRPFILWRRAVQSDLSLGGLNQYALQLAFPFRTTNGVPSRVLRGYGNFQCAKSTRYREVRRAFGNYTLRVFVSLTKFGCLSEVLGSEFLLSCRFLFLVFC